MTAAEDIQARNAQGQLMGGLFGLGGDILKSVPGLLGIFGLGSDRRDMTDIKRLGRDEASGLPIYAYRYKGDPKTYPKVVGPMAQDMEKQYPGSTASVDGHLVISPRPCTAWTWRGGPGRITEDNLSLIWLD